MLTNENKLILKLTGNILSTIVLVIVGLYFCIKYQNYYLAVFFAIIAIYTAFQFFQYWKIVRNNDYFEVEAKCLSSEFSSLGYSMTSSKIFNFKLTNPEDKDMFNIESDEFAIQAALSSLKEFKADKAPYQINSIYRFMFKKNKNDEPILLSNINFISSYLLREENEEKNNEIQKDISE